jgi:hypothetical protein
MVAEQEGALVDDFGSNKSSGHLEAGLGVVELADLAPSHEGARRANGVEHSH